MENSCNVILSLIPPLVSKRPSIEFVVTSTLTLCQETYQSPFCIAICGIHEEYWYVIFADWFTRGSSSFHIVADILLLLKVFNKKLCDCWLLFLSWFLCNHSEWSCLGVIKKSVVHYIIYIILGNFRKFDPNKILISKTPEEYIENIKKLKAFPQFHHVDRISFYS